MACPSGCLNGGGQIKLSQLNADEGINESEIKDSMDLLASVEKHHFELAKGTRELYHYQNGEHLVELLAKDLQKQDWFQCDFHPIDESDPMVQAQASLKW